METKNIIDLIKIRILCNVPVALRYFCSAFDGSVV